MPLLSNFTQPGVSNPLTPSDLAHWASRLRPLDRPEFHLFDRDAPTANPPKYQTKIDAVNARAGCKAVSTSRHEIENFVHHLAINACAHSQGLTCNLLAPYGPDDDVSTLLAAEINLTAPPHAKWNANRAKAWLAETVVPNMSTTMIAEIDPAGELLGWLNDINSMLVPPSAPAHG